MQVFTRTLRADNNCQRMSMRDVFTILQDIATEHVDSLNIGREYLKNINAAWVLTSERVQVGAMPKPGQELKVSTWAGSTKFALFPRYFLIEDMQGNELLRTGSLWTIMDLNTRKILYPGDTGLNIKGIVTGKETPLAKTIPAVKAEPETFRTVQPDDIDKNGHMNNTVYLDWFEDMLPRQLLEGSKINNLSIVYKKELRLGDRADIRTRRTDSDIVLQGTHNGATAFSISAGFIPV